MTQEAIQARCICVHGHFYQPPRENPWTGKIELQPGAGPFHDWNQRITAESYAPNSTASVLNSDGDVIRHVNNYSRISFNFGPTLLRWMQHSEPQTYAAVLAGDLESRRFYSGHGSAIAQAYHHSILPLANRKDKVTEIAWGIQDFEWRFGRKPEGMWLAETAADTATLEILASQGIRYTILSPFQADKTRPDGVREWVDVSGGRIDTRKAYTMKFPSGSEMAVFFYNGEIAKAVAFERLLENGDRFANRLRHGFRADETPQLVHIATDGETYGHHHKFGEMALAYTLQTLAEDPGARLTVYGEFLEQYPPRHEVQIVDGSSWSCTHGVERWRSNCGCQTGGDPHWTQEWRAPLRESLDWLRDALGPKFERAALEFFKDPWEARNHAVVFLLDGSRETEDRFYSRFSSHPLSEDERRVASKLLELQRYALMMFTSCGWFFNDLSGIETIQILRYAARAIELGEELFQTGFEAEFLRRLSRAKSNVPEQGDGAAIYRREVLSGRS